MSSILILAVGIVIGILLSMLAMLAHKFPAVLKKIPYIISDHKATIVNIKDPLDSIDLT